MNGFPRLTPRTCGWVLGAFRRVKCGGLAVAALLALLLVAPPAIAQTDGAQPADDVSNEVLTEKINSLWDAIHSVRREIDRLREEMIARVGGLREEMIARVDGLRAEMATEFASLRTNHQILLGVGGLIATLLTLLLGFVMYSHGNLQRQMSRMDERMSRMDEQMAEQNRQIAEQNRQIAEQNRRMDEQNRQMAEQNRRTDERMARMEEQNLALQEQFAIMQDQIARLLPPEEPAARRAVG